MIAKLILIGYLILWSLPLWAEPVLYLNMVQYIGTNRIDAVDTNTARITAEWIAVTNAADASNRCAVLAADSDYFGNDVAFDAVLHAHDHFNPTVCVETFVASHRSDTKPTTKFVELTEQIANPARYMGEHYILAVTDKTKADSLAKKIGDKDKTKTFTRKDVGL